MFGESRASRAKVDPARADEPEGVLSFANPLTSGRYE